MIDAVVVPSSVGLRLLEDRSYSFAWHVLGVVLDSVLACSNESLESAL